MEGSPSNDETPEKTSNSSASAQELESHFVSLDHELPTAEIVCASSDHQGEGTQPPTFSDASADARLEEHSITASTDLHLTLAFEELKLSVEAVLFAADRPLEVTEIRDIIGSVSLTDIRLALSDLGHDFEGRSIEIVELGRKYQLRTRQSFASTISRLFSGKPRTLSRSALETLAIVAYRQPVTRAEVNALRQVDSSQVMASLRERELIAPAGTRREPGSPVEYRTTSKFLEIFGLGDLGDLPKLRSLQMNVDIQNEVSKALSSLNEDDTPSLGSKDLALRDEDTENINESDTFNRNDNTHDDNSDDSPLHFGSDEGNLTDLSLESGSDVVSEEIMSRDADLYQEGAGSQPVSLEEEKSEEASNQTKATKRKPRPKAIDDSLGLARPVYSRAGASTAPAEQQIEEDNDLNESDDTP